MIAVDSASYPCLAVIQNFGVPHAHRKEVYEYGRHLLECHLGVTTLNLNLKPPWMTGIEHQQLLRNYDRAARKFGWG